MVSMFECNGEISLYYDKGVLGDKTSEFYSIPTAEAERIIHIALHTPNTTITTMTTNGGHCITIEYEGELDV